MASFIVGPIGSILGIFATISVARSRGQRRGLGLAIAAMPIGMTVWGMLAAISIPAFVSYTRRARTFEATANMERILQGAVLYHDRTGQLPPTTDWTPAVPCCEEPSPGSYCQLGVDPAGWEAPGWKAVGFTPEDSHYYQYRIYTEGDAVAAQARGDLDCDGVFSLFEHVARRAPGGLRPGGQVYRERPLE